MVVQQVLGNERTRALERRLGSEAIVPFLLSANSLLAGFCYYNTVANQAGWQGRLLFPGASIAALAIAGGWHRLFQGRELGAAVAIIGVESLLLIYATSIADGYYKPVQQRC